MAASTRNKPKVGEIIAPLPTERVTLYQTAHIGDIADIEEEVTRLRQLAPQSVAFTHKLLQLAQELEEQEILKLVEQYISKS